MMGDTLRVQFPFSAKNVPTALCYVCFMENVAKATPTRLNCHLKRDRFNYVIIAGSLT